MIQDPIRLQFMYGKLVATSQQIAWDFKISQSHLESRIESLAVSDEFRKSNFILYNAEDSLGEILKYYFITYDGFALLFSDWDDMSLKEAYISAYNRFKTIEQEEDEAIFEGEETLYYYTISSEDMVDILALVGQVEDRNIRLSLISKLLDESIPAEKGVSHG